MANNNLTPKIRTFNHAYEVMGLKSDATPVRSFTMMVSLNPADYSEGTDVEGLMGVLDAIETIGGTVPLVKLALGELAPVGSEIKVRMGRPYQGQRAIGDTRDITDTPRDRPVPQGGIMVTWFEVL